MNNQIPKGMRPGRRELNSASLRVVIPEGLGLDPAKLVNMREVLEVYVPHAARGRRLATALLNFVCQEADANGITLILTARQFADALGPDEERLVAWYRKFGFVGLQHGETGTIMARQVRPRPSAPRETPIAAAVREVLH